MTSLPSFLRKIPVVLYVAAAVFFVWGLVNAFIGISMATSPYMDDTVRGMVNLQKSNSLYSAALEATYLVANGALVHVLIALYDQRSADKGTFE